MPQGEWEDPANKSRCFIFLKSIEEVADLLYKQIAGTGRLGDVFTMKELWNELPDDVTDVVNDFVFKKVEFW